MTVGIGVLAEGGKWVILGSDMRASWPKKNKVGPHDSVGKIWDLPRPFECAVCVSGTLSVAQPLVSELASLLIKIGTKDPIYGEHVENAIDDARYRTQRRRVDWELRTNYCITLKQWLTGNVPGGKMSPVIQKAGEAIIDSTPLPVEILLGGFVRERLLFYKASGKRHLELCTSPPLFVIGEGGSLAMEILNRRGHDVDCSFPRALLHVAEALEYAEKEPKGTVGKATRIIVIHREQGIAQFSLDTDLIKGWKKAYAGRPSTLSLQQNVLARNQAIQLLLMHVRRGEKPPRASRKMP